MLTLNITLQRNAVRKPEFLDLVLFETSADILTKIIVTTISVLFAQIRQRSVLLVDIQVVFNRSVLLVDMQVVFNRNDQHILEQYRSRRNAENVMFFYS